MAGTAQRCIARYFSRRGIGAPSALRRLSKGAPLPTWTAPAALARREKLTSFPRPLMKDCWIALLVLALLVGRRRDKSGPARPNIECD